MFQRQNFSFIMLKSHLACWSNLKLINHILRKTCYRCFLTTNLQKNSKALKTSDAALDQFRAVLGDKNVITALATREQYCSDENAKRGMPADAVLVVQSTEEVSKIAKLCYDLDIPMVPHGAGTGMEQGISAPHGGVCVDLSQMDSILQVNEADFDAVVEPGVTWRNLNQYLHHTGLMFPVDPGADATLGGMSATSASGTNAVRYGTMKENVLNLEVVLADGTILDTAGPGKRARKSSAGYNLTSLFVGSEGTLGFITKVTLKLHAVPEKMVSAVCSFPHVKNAVDSVIQTLQSSIPMARIEFLNEFAMQASVEFDKLDYPVAPSLFLEFHGSQHEVEQQAKTAGEIMASNGGSNFLWAEDLETRNKLWKARHRNYYAVKNQRPGCECLVTDVCVPISNLTELILETQKKITALGICGSIIGHVGDGNFHTQLLYNPESKEEFQQVEELEHSIAMHALRLDGTCTGEHGIGVGKIGFLKEEYGEAGISVIRKIKQALDSKCLMNPGKVLQHST